MAPRTTRFVGPVLIGAGSPVLYTVPSDKSALLRWLSVGDTLGGLPATWSLLLNGTSAAAAVLLAKQSPQNGSLEMDLYLGLNPGDVVRGSAGVANRFAVTLSGYLYG